MIKIYTMKIKLTENLKYFSMLIYEINKLRFPKTV